MQHIDIGDLAVVDRDPDLDQTHRTRASETVFSVDAPLDAPVDVPDGHLDDGRADGGRRP
jgi:hypothetical protein